MKNLILARALAFCIDYFVLIFYGALLFAITMLFPLQDWSPIQAQMVGFVTLTLPVFLYFYLMERSKKGATLGKRVLNISVIGDNIFLRNLLKFIPWEIAHIGVHWSAFYGNQDMDNPTWVWIALYFPMGIMLAYFISIILSKGQSSLYDKWSNTNIEKIR